MTTEENGVATIDETEPDIRHGVTDRPKPKRVYFLESLHGCALSEETEEKLFAAWNAIMPPETAVFVLPPGFVFSTPGDHAYSVREQTGEVMRVVTFARKAELLEYLELIDGPFRELQSS